jgi:V8-like Glu-specific endopeptidase
VSNTDPDSEREVNVLMSHPASTGEARSGRARTQDGLERVEDRSPSAAAREAKAPDIQGLRDIAEASYGAPGPEPETVHGRDDRVRIQATNNYPWRVHSSLLITARDGSRWIGTGWFIGPHTLVTAGHVVHIVNSGVAGRDGWVRRIEVMPGRNAD